MAYLKKLFPAFFLIVLSFSVYGSPDSLGIKEKDGEKFIMHRVDQGQTLFSISQRYEVTVDQLKSTNPQTKDNLVVGEVILVPYEPQDNENESKGQYHKVKDDETLYSISQQYDIAVEKIKSWNNLSSNNIEPGMRLKVGTNKGENTGKEKDGNNGEENKKNINSPDSQKPKNSGIKQAKNNKGKKPDKEEDSNKNKKAEKTDNTSKSADNQAEKANEVKSDLAQKFREKQTSPTADGSGEMVTKNEEGKATWLSNIDSEKSLALHKSAPPGTIIKVTNLVNDRVVYVKTVGKLNKNEDEATLITISPQAAEKLNVKEDFFRAELEYSYREKEN